MTNIEKNIENIRDKIEVSAVKAGKRAEDITLIAVTKTRTPEEINEAIKLGIADIGENKVQEILDKYEKIEPVRWHMIGHLQTNKVKYIIDNVSLIHSVDSLKLAREIDKRSGQHNKKMDILIQINAADEKSKFGISADEARGIIMEILESCPNIFIKGLMSIVPYAEDPETVRKYFKEVNNIYEECKTINHPKVEFQYLSMGMSNDYPIAIEEGANAVRIGTSIFGERKYK